VASTRLRPAKAAGYGGQALLKINATAGFG